MATFRTSTFLDRRPEINACEDAYQNDLGVVLLCKPDEGI
jgi:hypothetical protein